MGEIFPLEQPAASLPNTGKRWIWEEAGQGESEHLHRCCLARELCRGKHVLDLASGEGYGSARLAQAASCVAAAEIDAQSVHRAGKAYKNPALAARSWRIFPRNAPAW